MKHQFAVVFGILCYSLANYQIASAGTCDCKSEISNASAVVSGTCSKIWSNDTCTLKETGAESTGLNMETSDWMRAVVEPLIKDGGQPVLLQPNEYYGVPIKASALQGLVIDSVHQLVDPAFALSVSKLIAEQAGVVESNWQLPTLKVISDGDPYAAVGDYCFYSESPSFKANFYVTVDDDNVCEAAKR